MNIASFLRTSSQVCVSMGGGDYICQLLEMKGGTRKEWDKERTARMTFVGLCVQGPWTHLQYQIMERLAAGTSAAAIAKKVVLGGLCFAPFSIAMTFTVVNFLQGKDMVAASAKIKKDLPDTWMAGTMYWPIIMTFNFKYIPIHNRPLFGAVAGSFWAIFMAYQANVGKKASSAPATLTTPSLKSTL